MQWPALVRAQSSSVTGIPAMVLERYNACQTVAFCGVFPEIKRAWATVDSRLYLWRYDRWWGPLQQDSGQWCWRVPAWRTLPGKHWVAVSLLGGAGSGVLLAYCPRSQGRLADLVWERLVRAARGHRRVCMGPLAWFGNRV